MLALPPRVEMVVVPPRLPDWMTVNPGALRRIWSMSVTCRASISCRSITVTDDPVSPAGTDVFVAVTTTGSMISAGSDCRSPPCRGGDHTRGQEHDDEQRETQMTRVILSSRRPDAGAGSKPGPGLLAHAIHLLPALPGLSPVVLRVSSPFTVAGQRRRLPASLRSGQCTAVLRSTSWAGALLEISGGVSGERRSMDGEARCDHALVLPRRQVGDARPAGLLALGSSYSPRLPSPYGPVALAGFVPEYSDGVAADSHRLPSCPLGNTSAKATTPYQTARHPATLPIRRGSGERLVADAGQGRRRYGRRSATAMCSPLNARGATVAGGASRVTVKLIPPSEGR